MAKKAIFKMAAAAILYF